MYSNVTHNTPLYSGGLSLGQRCGIETSLCGIISRAGTILMPCFFKFSRTRAAICGSKLFWVTGKIAMAVKRLAGMESLWNSAMRDRYARPQPVEGRNNAANNNNTSFDLIIWLQESTSQKSK